MSVEIKMLFNFQLNLNADKAFVCYFWYKKNMHGENEPT